MPARKANSSGKWSQSIWDVIPAAGDDVFANGFTVEIDVPIVVSSLRTTLSSGYAAAGGSFTLLSAISSVVANAAGFVAGTTACLSARNSTGTSFLTGNCTGGSAGGAYGVALAGTGNLTLSGNILGGTNSTAYGAFHNSTGNLTIVGNVSGSATTTGVFNNNLGNVFINAPNIIRGGTAASCNAIQNNSAGKIYVTGTVIGGTNATARGIINSSIGFVTVVGNVSAGTAGEGIVQSSTGTLFIDGNIFASPNQNAVASANAAARNEFTGALVNDLSGRQAVYAARYLLRPKVFESYTRMAGPSATNTPIFYYAPEAYNLSYVPHVSSVKLGTAYAAVSTLSGVNVNITEQLTGTMIVPSPQVVSFGTPIDNTIGTALNRPDLVWSVALGSLTGINTIGTRMANSVTFTEVGSALQTLRF